MKKLEFTNNDYRVGTRALFDKVVEVINFNVDVTEVKDDSVGIAQVSEEEIKAPLWKKWKALSELPEIDTDTKTTIKDVAEAYNALLKAIKE